MDISELSYQECWRRQYKGFNFKIINFNKNDEKIIAARGTISIL